MDKIDKAFASMIENLYKNTGKKLEEWIEIVKSKNIQKHGEIVSYLKNEHKLTHGYANLIGHRSKSSDSASAIDKVDLVETQYKGKESLRPIYEALKVKILALGDDIEIAPKKANVSFRRAKQFVLIGPATKSRFEVGLFLKNFPATDRLIAEKQGAMCTHKVNLANVEDIDDELLNWIKTSYDLAGK